MALTLPYADVALDIPGVGEFQYSVPPELDHKAVAGTLVRVPVRKSLRIGVVVHRTDESKAKKHKPIDACIMPDYHIAPDLIQLSRWMAEYYMCSLGETLAAVSFFGLRAVSAKTIKKFKLKDPATVDVLLTSENPEIKVTAKQREVLRVLQGNPGNPLAANEIKDLSGAGKTVIDKLIEKGLLDEIREAIHRADWYDVPDDIEPPLELSAEQKDAYKAICESLDKQKFQSFLLHGITGSGKTEVYLHAIDHALNQGRQSIVLVPEIALTPQTVERFRHRFGKRVGVYHSHLNLGQKYDLYRQIVAGEIDVLVGTRSAVFAPFPQLGLIVLDEEHETSYKQDSTPRYHAREVALIRARNLNAAVIMGSATPSLESYYNADEGKYTLLTLKERPGATPLPPVNLIDMREELRRNQNPGLFSQQLIAAIRERIEWKEQTILFLNRRGYHPIVMCRDCNLRFSCDNDDVLLTWHKKQQRLVCHLCGETKPLPTHCPECDSESLHAVGVGTERIEEEIDEIFPDARVVRVDLDTVTSKFDYQKKWREINEGKCDIILGTQMIAKGFDLPRVTLVGVVLADVSLFQPDFRSAERTFSLMTQVSGRAGRREKQGEVIIQTYCPEHYGIIKAQQHDYIGFYQKEIHIRRILRFPPYFRLAGFIITGEDAGRTQMLAKSFGYALDRQIRRGVNDQSLRVLGPAPAAIAWINKKYRWRLLLRGTSPAEMRRIIRDALADYHTQNPRGESTDYGGCESDGFDVSFSKKIHHKPRRAQSLWVILILFLKKFWKNRIFNRANLKMAHGSTNRQAFDRKLSQ